MRLRLSGPTAGRALLARPTERSGIAIRELAPERRRDPAVPCSAALPRPAAAARARGSAGGEAHAASAWMRGCWILDVPPLRLGSRLPPLQLSRDNTCTFLQFSKVFKWLANAIVHVCPIAPDTSAPLATRDGRRAPASPLPSRAAPAGRRAPCGPLGTPPRAPAARGAPPSPDGRFSLNLNHQSPAFAFGFAFVLHDSSRRHETWHEVHRKDSAPCNQRNASPREPTERGPWTMGHTYLPERAPANCTGTHTGVKHRLRSATTGCGRGHTQTRLYPISIANYRTEALAKVLMRCRRLNESLDLV